MIAISVDVKEMFPRSLTVRSTALAHTRTHYKNTLYVLVAGGLKVAKHIFVQSTMALLLIELLPW